MKKFLLSAALVTAPAVAFAEGGGADFAPGYVLVDVVRHVIDKLISMF
jgi:hypothetical protein